MAYIKRIPYREAHPYAHTKIITTGDLVEVRSCAVDPHEIPIIKISKDEYVFKETGEVLKFKHIPNRSCCTSSLARSFRELRYIINSNVTEDAIERDRIRWCTLTFNRIVTDTAVLYDEERRFIQRLRYYCCKHFGCNCKFEYIAVAEPMGERAGHRWHLHLILIFIDTAPYIANDDLAKVWSNGFVRIERLKGSRIRNLASYLTAYLSDVPLNPSDDALASRGKGKKSVLKGMRTMLYPPGMNLYRVSRGINRPSVDVMYRYKADEKMEGAKLLARKAIAIIEDRTYSSEYYSEAIPHTCQVLSYKYYDTSPTARAEVKHIEEWWQCSNDRIEILYDSALDEEIEIAKEQSSEIEILYLIDSKVEQ